MKNMIAGFSKQLQEAIEIGKKIKLTVAPHEIKNVVISGLGGSGIGGTIVSELVAMEISVPVQVVKGYFIPNYVDKNTLVIISSYSGNTEETVNCMETAIQKNAKIVCITSGGKIAEIAKQNQLDYIIIPGGMPPRTCLGYSFTQQFFILTFFGLLKNNFLKELENAIQLIDTNEKNIQEEAKIIAGKLKNKLPVIYSTTYNEGIAIRLRQQLNENAKILCWHHVIPEMNHNELVGWTEKSENLAVIIFRDKNDFARNQTRIEINKKVFEKYTSTIIEIYSKGNSLIEKAIYLIHLGDWISYFVAEQKGVDAIEVNVINHLKAELGKL
ncbi:MAG TPA: bifunctional phosphoglucose/phosphomannose isomerase [Bacteroidia bacterium]|nr:bifunctional phosphoglucose/phosphomannose isomerase [Bacteroidia bacterium]